MRKHTRITAFLLLSILIFLSTGISSYAAENVREIQEGRLEGEAPKEFYGEPTKAKTITHAKKFDGHIIEKGVDVSYHNDTINWKKVKKAGIDFAIIRVAARSVSPAGNMIYDYMFPENIEGAQKAGLDVGVYIYSQATTKAEAVVEAEYVLEKIDGYQLELPVVFDYEYYYSGDYKGRLQKDKMTDRERTDVCQAFCEVIEDAGYDAMIYANRTMLRSDLYADELDEKYEIWLAEWTNKSAYENDYTYWQYSASGKVNGIPSKTVDMNFRYYLPYFKATMRTTGSIYLNWTEVEEAEGYHLYQLQEDGTYQLIQDIEGKETTSFLHEGLAKNTEYTYKLCYYLTDELGETVEIPTEYSDITETTLDELEKTSLSGKALDAGRIKLVWEEVEGADGYILQRYSETQKTYTNVKTVKDSGQLSYVNTGLTVGTEYKYRIKAYADSENGRVYGPYSKVKTITTTSKLVKPKLKGVAKSSSKLEISWDRVQGATGYQVQRYQPDKKKYVTLKTFTSGTKLNYTSTGLKAGTTYKYRVRALANKGEKTVYSYYSDVKSVKTLSVLSAPKLDVSTKTYTSLRLKWKKVTDADGYVIQRYNNTTKKYVTIKTIEDGDVTSYTNTYLNSETTYKYRMRAYTEDDGNRKYSSYSKADSAKTSKRRTGEVTATILNVRSGADTSYKKIASLKEGAKVSVTGSRKGWYRVRVKVKGSYKTGYVSKEYLELL